MVRTYFVNRKIDLLAVLSVVVILLLSACATSASTPGSSATATPTSAASSTTATATLKHVPTGTANVSWTPTSQGLTVKISLLGLAPNSTHPAYIQSGSCAKQGAVVYPLNNVVADSHGVGSSTTVINNVKTLQPTGWYINVRNGPQLSPADQFLPIVCSDLTFSNIAPTSSLSLHVPLTAAPGSSESESARGTAHLSLSGSTLTVKLMLTGLQPGTSHAAHIHTGSCQSQGAVVYPLNNVIANSSGNYNGTTTIKNVLSIPGSGWYVNVHYSTNLSTQTGYNPIACGNVMLAK